MVECTYPSIVDKGDERNEPEVFVDFVLVITEFGDINPPHGHQIQVALVAAALHQDDRFAQRVLQMLQRLPALGALLEIRVIELIQQVADELQMLGEILAILLVHAGVVSRFHNHGYELHSVDAHQLAHVGHIAHRQPWHPIEQIRHCNNPARSSLPQQAPSTPLQQPAPLFRVKPFISADATPRLSYPCKKLIHIPLPLLAKGCLC